MGHSPFLHTRQRVYYAYELPQSPFELDEAQPDEKAGIDKKSFH